MTTVTPARPMPQSMTRPSGPAGPGNAGMPAIDPFKLLQRHWQKLMIAGAAGVVVGVAAHFTWMAIYPIYRAEAVFQCEAAPAEDNIVASANVDADEIDRFMATQSAIMVSQRVLERAMQDPKLQSVARSWCRQYVRNGVFSYQEAATDLADTISSHVIPETYLISMSMHWKNKEEVAGIVGVVRTAYLTDLATSGNASSSDVKQAFNKTINDLEKQVADLQDKRDKLLEGGNVDALDVRTATARDQLNDLNEQLLAVDTNLRAAQVQLQQLTMSVRTNATINYPDEFKAMVESDPSIQRIKATIDQLEAQKLAYQVQGIGPEHRITKAMLAQIAGQQETLNATREKLLQIRRASCRERV